MKNKPRIVSFDWETSPQLGYFFGPIWETNIIKVVEHEQILCGAFFEHGKNRPYVIGQDDLKGYKPGVLNDKKLCIRLSVELAKYDYIAGHNSDQFDLKVLNTRLAFHGLPPISNEKTFDTKKFAKSKLHLPSNKLDDIAQFFGLGEKLHHPGLNMWFGCEAGYKKDWRIMKKYCGQDTVLTDKILGKLLPFVKLTKTFHGEERRVVCSNPICLSTNLAKHDKKRVAKGWKQQYQCKDCGRYTTDSKLIKI